MGRYDEFMSDRYSDSELAEMRNEMRALLEMLHAEHGNVDIEVSYRESDMGTGRVIRRDVMWTVQELLSSLEWEHDAVYFSDLEPPTEGFARWSIFYDSVKEEENIYYEELRREKAFLRKRCAY